ncbi:MAG TPA: SAM-dependent methyltransferase [Terriglobia bacterium]|nr:SAM-dependent methyltransferase [Terriglobia bacterium]
MTSPLVNHLQRRIREHGPISFRSFMEEALYHPEFGYYTSDRNPIGREGDFYTSSDLDPIFGKLLARKFEQMAASLQIAQEQFTVLELGAGRGLLAREILTHHRFRYGILERSGPMKQRQQELLREFDVEWFSDLPQGISGCIFSNEFFDALPVRRIVRRGQKLQEIYVTADFSEIEGDLQEPLEVPLAEGQLADIGTDSRLWIGRIAQSLKRGYHLAIDYGYEDREFYARPHGTLMCYWRHQAVEDPYVRVGEQDITAHVNFSDLMREGTAGGLHTETFQTQMQFLIQLGILTELESLVPARTVKDIQRLAALKKLILPDGMGERFKVLVQRTASREI